MTTLDLENLETLLAAATPGPWEESKNDPNGIGNASGGDVASNYANSQGGICYQEDRALIVALRNAAPALIARVRELEAEKDTVIDWEKVARARLTSLVWEALPDHWQHGEIEAAKAAVAEYLRQLHPHALLTINP